MIRRVSKKKKKFSTEPVYKDGVEVARNIAYALKLDEANRKYNLKGRNRKENGSASRFGLFWFSPGWLS